MKITFTDKEECLRYLKNKLVNVGQELRKKSDCDNHLDFTDKVALMLLNNKEAEVLEQIRIVETYSATQWEFEE